VRPWVHSQHWEKKKPMSNTGPIQVVHTCNSSTWEAEQEDLQFKVSLDYIVRPYHIYMQHIIYVKKLFTIPFQ
jgi:hypothetical protein